MRKVITTLVICLQFTFVFTSCLKKAPEPAAGTKITAKFYFTGAIGGKEVVFQDGVNGYGSGAGYSGGSDYSGYQEVQSMVITKGLNPNNSISASLIKYFPEEPTNDMIESMFHLGKYSFGREHDGSADSGKDGVQIIYVDSDGIVWSTDLGTEAQPNGSFEIIEHINNTHGWSEKITKATFNCILYDEEGNSMLLTNGIIRGRSVQYHH